MLIGSEFQTFGAATLNARLAISVRGVVQLMNAEQCQTDPDHMTKPTIYRAV